MHAQLWDDPPLPRQEDSEPASEAAAIEPRIVRLLAEMLGDPDFFFPLSAANKQFRAFYYGMASAALLEDVFVDALYNFIRRKHPETDFRRPDRGEKGWDYQIEGLNVSHKVGLKAAAIAVLWDATVEMQTYSVESPIVFMTADYPRKYVRAVIGGAHHRMQPLSSLSPQALPLGSQVLAVHWPAGGGAATIVWSVRVDHKIQGEGLSFRQVWGALSTQLAGGRAANEVEVLVHVPTKGLSLPAPLEGASIDFEQTMRPGLYLLATATLQHVPVTRNNRAILIPKGTVEDRMTEATRDGRFIPVSTWSEAFALNRPPDLYLAQRADWDSRFSAAAGH